VFAPAPPNTKPPAAVTKTPLPAAAAPVSSPKVPPFLNVPAPSSIPVPTASSVETPVNPLVQPGASPVSQPPSTLVHPLASQPPSTLVHPLGGGSHPPGGVSQPPRPSYSPNVTPSGSITAGTDVHMRELQGQVMRARQELATTQMELRTTRGEVYNLRAELASAKTRIEELEAELRKVHAAAQAAVPTTVGDDLEAIKVIGPKFEKLLRSAGLTTLAQIAGWSDTDLDAIAKKLGVKAERIRKDDWVGNAKRLTGGA
jgi:predicted flap endonuclease-1-like 5' DNA nuclease